MIMQLLLLLEKNCKAVVGTCMGFWGTRLQRLCEEYNIFVDVAESGRGRGTITNAPKRSSYIYSNLEKIDSLKKILNLTNQLRQTSVLSGNIYKAAHRHIEPRIKQPTTSTNAKIIAVPTKRALLAAVASHCRRLAALVLRNQTVGAEVRDDSNKNISAHNDQRVWKENRRKEVRLQQQTFRRCK